MRRFALFISVLLLALSLSGAWTIALAALCPHAGGEESAQAAMAEDHSCCQARLLAHDHQSSAHAGHMGAQEHEMSGAVVEAAPAESCSNESAVKVGAEEEKGKSAFRQKSEQCGHCMSRSELPANFTTRQTNQIRRVQESAPASDGATEPLAFISASYVRAVLARQGAPPGTSARKHLLINVFII